MLGQIQMMPWRISDYQFQTMCGKKCRSIVEGIEIADLLDEVTQKMEDAFFEPLALACFIDFHMLGKGLIWHPILGTCLGSKGIAASKILRSSFRPCMDCCKHFSAGLEL